MKKETKPLKEKEEESQEVEFEGYLESCPTSPKRLWRRKLNMSCVDRPNRLEACVGFASEMCPKIQVKRLEVSIIGGIG